MTEYKLIIAGGRDFGDYPLLSRIIRPYVDSLTGDEQISVVSGAARGADSLGKAFALEHNLKLYEFPADWDTYGKRAGYIRNAEMGDFADLLVAFWDGESRGTRHMITYMQSLEKPVTVISY